MPGTAGVADSRRGVGAAPRHPRHSCTWKPFVPIGRPFSVQPLIIYMRLVARLDSGCYLNTTLLGS
jgi:hypothetical protein